ncbi:keratin-associated protein 21-2-like [Sapajus apella]|uniref:Keratin-associated protein 21-2-like n=1 Tax=Sapajus apella TaxID=9515 RepID=A0A6J3HSG3_SAPAP|nr:keratin-associated protein 21-2-like [Sapajus apella]
MITKRANRAHVRMTHAFLDVYKDLGRVEDTHTSETSSYTFTEISPPDTMCCNYYRNSCGGCGYSSGWGSGCGSGYGCGYGSGCGYGCGYSSGCGYGCRYDSAYGLGSCYGCGYSSGCCGYQPFCYRRCYSSCC